MSADEGTIQDNNLGQSSLEPTLQKEQESESRHEEEKGMGAEPATTMTVEEKVGDSNDDNRRLLISLHIYQTPW